MTEQTKKVNQVLSFKQCPRTIFRISHCCFIVSSLCFIRDLKFSISDALAVEGREVGFLEGAVLAKEGLCFNMEESLAEGVVKRDGRLAHKKEKAAPPHRD